MSRHYQYTRLTDTRLNWPVGVDSTEVLIAEFRHDDGLPAQAEPSEANGFGGITVLIDLCKSVDSRNAFAAIAGALEFARTSWFVVNTSDLVDFLAKRVHELAADWIDVIIYAPDDKSEQVAEEQHRIDNIRAALQGSLGLLFIVTDSADQPNSLVRITAVIHGLSGERAATAASLFLAIACLGGPTIHSCVDHADVRILFSERPVESRTGTLVEGIWLCEKRMLLFGSEAQRQAVSQAAGVYSVFPMLQNHRFADFHAFDGFLKEIGDNDARPILTLAGPSLLRSGQGNPGIIRVIMLCADRTQP